MSYMNRPLSLVLVASALVPELLVCSLERLGVYGVIALAVGLLAALKPNSAARWIALGWGFSVPLTPLAGARAMESGSLILLLFIVWLSRGVRWFSWGTPILLYLVGTTLYETYMSVIGVHSFLSVVRLDEVSRVRDALRSFFAVQCPSWRYLTHVVLLIGAVDVFSASRDFSLSWRKSFLYGAALSAVYAIVQWCGLTPFHLPNQTPFWTSIGRVSGLMTDPNALGVVMALSLLILTQRDVAEGKPGRYSTGLTLLFLGAGVVSGSRTFWLGVGIVVVGLTYLRARRLLGLLFVGGLSAIAIMSALDIYTPFVSIVQESSALPQGVKRIVSAMSLARFEETMASRSVFLTLARAIIDRDPLFGVGANAFASYVPLASASIPSLKGWIDNSNNFYVGVVAELGLIGLFAGMMTALSRRRKAEGAVAGAAVALCAVGIMLLTGPHTDFVEVLLPIALLVGMTTTVRRTQSYLRAYTSVLFLVAGSIAGSHHDRGVYGWHADGDRLHRWLSPDATVQVLCAEAKAGEEQTVIVKPSYVPSREPLRLFIQSPSFSQEIQLSDASEREIPLRCGRYHFSVTPAWSPARAWPQNSNDRRLLGVEQIIRP